MREDLTEVVFILDRSGSMSGLEEDTIGGFNSMIKKQKKEKGEVLISTVLFDDQSEVLYDRVEIQRVEPMTEDQYYVRGCTALLDAVGGAINYIEKRQKEVKKDQRPGKTLFVITTDGMENASRKYSYDKVKKMVEHQKKKREWEFIFLGANIDAVEVASRFGVDKKFAKNYKCDKRGTAVNFDAIGGAISALRSCPDRATFEAETMCCLSSIDEDFSSR